MTDFTLGLIASVVLVLCIIEMVLAFQAWKRGERIENALKAARKQQNEITDEMEEFYGTYLDIMLDRPRMHGGREAVETQVILILEMLTLIKRPDLSGQQACKRVKDAWTSYLLETFGTNLSLSGNLPEGEAAEEEFVGHLERLRERVMNGVVEHSGDVTGSVASAK